jgi:L-ascorbate metabolism protein UlaG (beta-lactamase superfamily)
MKFRLSVTLSAFMAAGLVQAQMSSVSTVPATGGDIQITALGHASVQLEQGGKVILVDPVGMMADLSKAKQADLILVTDIHGDHLDTAAITKLRKQGAPVVIPPAATDKVPGAVVMANRAIHTVAGVPITAIPAYNIRRGPKEGEFYHSKGRGNGYVLTLGGKQVFLAGDTECVPAIKILKNIDVAFIPMNLPYTMPPSEAAECVKAFKPKIVFPYHFMGQKPEEFAAALKGEPIEVRILNWYPNAK